MLIVESEACEIIAGWSWSITQSEYLLSPLFIFASFPSFLFCISSSSTELPAQNRCVYNYAKMLTRFHDPKSPLASMFLPIFTSFTKYNKEFNEPKKKFPFLFFRLCRRVNTQCQWVKDRSDFSETRTHCCVGTAREKPFFLTSSPFFFNNVYANATWTRKAGWSNK